MAKPPPVERHSERVESVLGSEPSRARWRQRALAEAPAGPVTRARTEREAQLLAPSLRRPVGERFTQVELAAVAALGRPVLGRLRPAPRIHPRRVEQSERLRLGEG